MGSWLVLVLLGSSTAPAVAQAPLDSLTQRSVRGGITLLLPASWRPLSDSLQATVNQVLDTTLANTRDSTLRASLKNGRPVMLMQEVSPANASISGSINASPSPGTTATVFAQATPEQVAEAMAPVCPGLQDILNRAGARVISCDAAVTDTVAGRTIVVTHLVRSGPGGFVTVWLVQYPEANTVYTLTLNAPQAEDAHYAPLYRTIWHSVKIPPGP